jgi:hypothetical protein
VVDGVTGVTFGEPTAESLAAAVEAHRRTRWDSREIRRHAEGFDIPVFRRRMAQFIEERVA